MTRTPKIKGTTERTTSAQSAFETLRPSIPVVKAWNRLESGRTETEAYMLFGSLRIARRKDGSVRMARPQKMPLIVSVEFTKKLVMAHCETAVPTAGLCGISTADVLEFLRTGEFTAAMGKFSLKYHEHLKSMCDDAPRNRWIHAREQTRAKRRENLVDGYVYSQEAALQGRIKHHMTGAKRSLMGIHRQIVHVVWRSILDRDVALATLRIYGRTCTMADYNRVVKAWKAPCGVDGTRDRGISSLRETHRAAFVLQRAMPAAKDVPLNERVESVPAWLRALTGSARLWRTARTWSDPQLTALHRIILRVDGRTVDGPDRPMDRECGMRFLERLCERGPWPASALAQLSWMLPDRLEPLEPFLPALHVAILEARRKRRLGAFLQGVHLVGDMLQNLAEDDYDHLAANARNATWARMDERQIEWHRERAEILRQEEAKWNEAYGTVRYEDDAAWPPLLTTYEDENGVATEIVDAAGLRAEALEMTHCVDGYVPDCLAGHSHIFSLRSGEARSTLELQIQGGVWQILQNFGPENEPAPRKLGLLAKAVRREANRSRRKTAD